MLELHVYLSHGPFNKARDDNCLLKTTGQLLLISWGIHFLSFSQIPTRIDFWRFNSSGMIHRVDCYIVTDFLELLNLQGQTFQNQRQGVTYLKILNFNNNAALRTWNLAKISEISVVRNLKQTLLLRVVRYLFLYMQVIHLKWDKAGCQQIVIQRWYGEKCRGEEKGELYFLSSICLHGDGRGKFTF